MNILSSGTAGMILSQRHGPLWSVSPDATVFEAIQLMAGKNVGALLVMSGEQLVGVVSERDYTRKVALRGKSSKDTPVSEIVSAEIVSVTPAHSVEDCMRLMTGHRVRHLPVLDGGRILGIISIGDLVNWTISAQEAALSQMENYIAGQY